MNIKRLETSRLFHRFGFGPRPSEYAQALKDGVDVTRAKLTTTPAVQTTITPVALPEITDLGKRPEPNTPEVVPFAQVADTLLDALDNMHLYHYR